MSKGQPVSVQKESKMDLYCIPALIPTRLKFEIQNVKSYDNVGEFIYSLRVWYTF